MRLADKTAIVTGPGKGLGKAIARKFLQEGANVVLADFDESLLEETSRQLSQGNDRTLAVTCDVSNSLDVQRMVDATVKAFGTVNILINNAVRHYYEDLLDTSEDDWDKTIAAGMKAIYLTCRAVIPHMIEAGGGSIVNIGSTNQLLPNTHTAAYAAAKGGSFSLTQQIAVEYGHRNIRCNTISPAGMLTEATRKNSPQHLRTAARLYALGRIAEPEEVANAVLFLASDQASFITGVNLPVDGGHTVLSSASLVTRDMKTCWGRAIDQDDRN